MFELVTDHKPPIKLFGENSSMPEMTSARTKRWALKLCHYTYSTKFKSTHDIAHADGLSRLTQPLSKQYVPPEEGDVLIINHLEDVGVLSAGKVGNLTRAPLGGGANTPPCRIFTIAQKRRQISMRSFQYLL